MSWSVAWTRSAQKDLRRLDQQAAQRVYRAVHRFASTGQGDIRILRGSENERRLRVGDLRVRFTQDNQSQTIHVLRVLPRDSAYRE